MQLLMSVGKLGGTLPWQTRDALTEFMVLVTSYYTNAMEGNPSKLKDIEDALNNKLADHLSAYDMIGSGDGVLEFHRSLKLI
jgi:hypothetical protein